MNGEAILAESYKRLIGGDPRAAEEALAPLWNASARKPAKALHLLALIRRAQERASEAEQLLRAAIAADPGDAEQHNNLGHLLLNSGRAEAAVQCFRDALKCAPGMEAARLNLARALNALERGAEAESVARAALARNRSVEALRAFGNSVGLQGRHSEALAAFEEALKLRPGHFSARCERAIALHKLGRSEEAIEELQALASDAQASAETYKAFASTLMDVGRHEEAETQLFKAVRAFPRDAKLQGDLARLRWMRGESAARFASEMERTIEDAPDDVAMRVGCAELLYRTERMADAETMVREGLARAPNAARLWTMLGFLQDEQGDPEGALPALKRAMEFAPDAEGRKLLTHAYLRAGQPDAALREIAIGLKEAPLDQIWLTYLATAQRMRGDPQFHDLYNPEEFIRVVDIDAPAPWRGVAEFNLDLAQELDALHLLTAHPLNQTLREGTQTARDLTEIETPAIQAFLKSAREALRGFSASLPAHKTHPFLSRRKTDVAFNGCWSVRLRAGGHHVNHVHHKGWISSAYYVRLPPPAAEDKPHAGWLKFGEPRIPIPGCAPFKYVEPKVGRLVLFPSYMWHGTEPFARGDRLTIAFDAIPA